MTCDGCKTDTETPVLVPKFPKGAQHYCVKPACQRTAHRMAVLAFQHISGRRGKRVRA